MLCLDIKTLDFFRRNIYMFKHTYVKSNLVMLDYCKRPHWQNKRKKPTRLFRSTFFNIFFVFPERPREDGGTSGGPIYGQGQGH